MVEQLFGSKTRVKLLQLFYGNPNRAFYVREITRKIDEQINSVRRELANLLSIGIISSENTNNKLYYEVNQKYEHYKSLSQIFSGGAPAQSAGEEAGEEDGLKSLGNVELAILTGQFTRDDRSGIDLLLVGDLNQTQVGKYVANLEKKEGKEIRYATMPADEFTYRKNLNDRFLVTVLESKKQVLADRENLLEKKKSKKDKKETKEEE
ncbi:MAG: transcriptional regulator [Candidatus Saccharimonadales bacterium]